MSFLRVSQLGWWAVRNLMESIVTTVGVACRFWYKLCCTTVNLAARHPVGTNRHSGPSVLSKASKAFRKKLNSHIYTKLLKPKIYYRISFVSSSNVLLHYFNLLKYFCSCISNIFLVQFLLNIYKNPGILFFYT